MTSKLVLVFVPTISLSIEQEFCAGVNQALAGQDIRLLYAPIGYLPEDEDGLNHWYLSYVSRLKPDLILTLSVGLFSFSTEKVFHRFLDLFKGIPVISAGHKVDDIPSIVLDHFTGMAGLVDELMQRRPDASFVYVSGPPKNVDSNNRLDALKTALVRVGRSADEIRVLLGDFTTNTAKESFTAYLSEVETPADIIVCANDFMAMGVLEILESRNIRCPEDIWVTGYDDYLYASYASPSLSTVHYQAYDLGLEAVYLGLKLIKNECISMLSVLTPQPIFRESTGDRAPTFMNSAADLLEQWRLLRSRDTNSRKLTTLRQFYRHIPVQEMLKLTRESIAELDVEHLSIFVSSVNEEGITIFRQIGLHDNGIQTHVDQMSLPEDFTTAEESVYWVMCPLSIDQANYGYLIAKSPPVSGEFIEFIAPHYAELLHAEALEARNERYRIQTELNERMVSLGSLVSGVAHEINTPIGTGKLAASSLIESVSNIKRKFDEQTLTKSEFDIFITEIDDISEIIYHSMDRAADLIKNFKMVSVDQTSETKRQIDLGEYIESVLLSLRHQLKNSLVSLQTELEAGISIETYPGAIAQVITNLFMNALKHGFNYGQENGTILIRLQSRPNGFKMTFSDDGAGSTEEVLKHIFDPFFTTSRGDGGTGLGMHIVFNLVSQKLHWSITVESEPKQGFYVTLRPINEFTI